MNRIIDAFDLFGKEVIFTYGDIIYNPNNIEIPDHLLTHEKTHQYQQKAIGKDLWWDKYLTDSKFRIEQELEAYSRQYKHICRLTKDRNERNRILHKIAELLSGPMYGNAISKNEALSRVLIGK